MQKRAARRGTRALAFLLCLLMAVSLLPVMGANAAVGDVSATGVELNKTLTLQDDGTYAITLEAFATGMVTSTEVMEPVPTDFVLVLDQSGSMADDITSYTYNEQTSRGYTYNSVDDGEYYYKDGDAYYKVSHSSSGKKNNKKYYLSYENNGRTYYLTSDGTTTDQNKASYATKESDTIWTGVLYTRTESSQTKLAALKTAVTNFVTSVQNQKYANGNSVDHRIAIVGFASGSSSYQNTELFVGSSTYTFGTSEIDDQYVNALQDVTTSTGRNNLSDSIDALDADGSTYAQYGFKMANEVLDKRTVKTYQKADKTTANRGAVVVMFTDGQPGYNSSNRDQLDTANAVTLEANTTKGTAKVFTIGVFSVADSTKLKTSSGRYTVDSAYTIADYMNAVSSNYPQATNLSSMGNRSTDGVNYYATASDSKALNDAFQSVPSSVNSSSTSCELDTASVLKDVISEYLDLPEGISPEKNVTVSTATCIGKDEDGNPNFDEPVKFSDAIVTVTDNTVSVSNFDYKNNYVTGEKGTGKKLIVKITGLLPNRDGADMPSNETTSGIYDNDALVAQFEVPTFDVASRNVVLDFSMTANIANVAGVQGNKRVSTHDYGNFTYGENNLTYKLNTSVENGRLVFDGIDSALYFGHAYGDNTATNAWTKVNVIPANNVYFDDDLLNEQSDFNDGNYGYDVNVPPTTNTTSVQPENGENMAVRTFTFTGTGIDVYCTTESTSGWVTARLSKMEDGMDTYVDGAIMKNQYVSEPCLYNVPTLSFTGLDYGTYTLTINTDQYSNYKLDGVRVYNPGNTDVQSQYDESEVNAVFTKVRDILLNDQESFTVDNEVVGAVYVDEQHEGATLEKYEKEGPKNEVYLGTGDAIAFNVKGYQQGQKVMIGLSAPEAGTGSVKLTKAENAEVLQIASVIDEYYVVTPDANGNVVIKNAGNSLISVTNVKVSGTGASSASIEVSPQLMSYVESFDTLSIIEPETPVTPDPTPETPNNTISAIIHAIWSSVRDSIGRLFGRL